MEDEGNVETPAIVTRRVRSRRGDELLRGAPAGQRARKGAPGGHKSVGERAEMGRRGRGRRSRPSSVVLAPDGHLLRLALILILGVPSVHCSSSTTDPKESKVVGSTRLPVKVYVKVDHDSPRLLCVTNHLRNSELIDPVFQWHGPGGDMVPGNRTAQVTPTGTLLLRRFQPEMSGVYTCSLVFKAATEREEKSYVLKYVVYAYSDPDVHYEVTARYHAAPCSSGYNADFEKKLLQILSKLLAELSCEIAFSQSECHRVKMQRAGLQNVLFLTFAVSAVEEKGRGACQKSACDVSRRLQKAKDLVERFFSQQVDVLEKRTAPLPEIYYVEGTLQTVWVSRCHPGYGINAQLHPGCPRCCVVCGPGSYNPREGVHCLPCHKRLAYGAKTC